MLFGKKMAAGYFQQLQQAFSKLFVLKGRTQKNRESPRSNADWQRHLVFRPDSRKIWGLINDLKAIMTLADSLTEIPELGLFGKLRGCVI